MKTYQPIYRRNRKSRPKQQGVALAIGIILLLIISVIGVNSMKSALLQEKMAGGLVNRNFADAAAYSLLISVENYLHVLFENNNGVEDPQCDYCGAEARGNEWHSFTSQKHMLDGATYPGGSSHLGPLLPHLHDVPRFVLYNTTAGSGGGANSYNETVGESDDGSAGGFGGQTSGGINDSLSFYRIAAKANDITGNFYVVYESVYALREN